MKKSSMIIINPVAGKEDAEKYEDMIKKTVETKYDNILVKYTEGEGDASKFAKAAAKDNFDLIISVGGDGTVNETVNGLAEFEHPPILGIIPMGTVNDLARALNIPLEPEKAVELLVTGIEKKIDIGIVNNRTFTNILGVGKATKAIHDVNSDDKAKLGSLAYAISIAKEIIGDDIFPVKLEMDEEDWEGDVSVIIVGLIDSLGGFKFPLVDVEVGDGMFHIFAIKRLNVSKLIKMAPSLTLGKIKNSENVKYFKSKKIKIKALNNNKYESDIDGEKGPELPLELKILPKHLGVISGMTSKDD